jgi:four helix bundle protein
MIIKHFEELEIWQEARKLSKYIYKLTSTEPFKRDFRFRDQIRAAAGSTMDNIAEGFARGGNKEFYQFLSVSKGSCGEVRSQAYRAFDNEYIDANQFDELLERTEKIYRKTINLMNHLKTSENKGSKYN